MKAGWWDARLALRDLAKAISTAIKDREISKSDQTIVYLKEWMLINGKSFQYKCYEIGYAELSEKVTVFKKYLLLKKFFFWNSSCSEVVPASKKYMLWRIT